MELKVYTIDGRGEPSRLLLVIHGFSANEFHLAAYGPLIDPEARFLVAAPRGPLGVPPDGAAWWDIDSETFERDYSLFTPSLRALDRSIDRLCEQRGFRREQAVIGGFSQGAALALALAFRRGAAPVAGVVCLSGFLVEDPPVVDWDLESNRSVPVFVGHGTEDPFIGIKDFRHTVEVLSEAGVSVESHTFPMAHDITLDELGLLRAWLAAR
jgi:phospholipase/carboxylesterase